MLRAARWTPSHNFVDYIFATGKTCWDVHTIWPTSGPVVSTGFASWQRHSSSGRQPNLAALNRGRHLYSAGRPSRWASAHYSAYSFYRPTTTLVWTTCLLATVELRSLLLGKLVTVIGGVHLQVAVDDFAQEVWRVAVSDQVIEWRHEWRQSIEIVWNAKQSYIY